MAPRSTFELYDRLVFNGTLAETLTGWRAEHDTLETIVQKLASHNVIVSTTTVFRWVRELDAVAS